MLPINGNSQRLIMMQEGPRVVLPTLMTNDIGRNNQSENADQEISTVMVDSYNSLANGNVNNVMMQYQTNDINTHENDRLLMNDLMRKTNTSNSHGKYGNTLVGRISQILREEKRALLIEELVMHLAPVFGELRKMDGTRYKGNMTKAVNGALSSTGIFDRLDNGRWVIREEELEMYEMRTQKKIESKGKRKRIYGTVADDEEKKRRKYSKRRDRKQGIIQILSSISDMQRCQSQERNSIYFENPFRGLNGMEDSNKLFERLGPDRFSLCIQIYAYFEDLFKIASGDVRLDLQNVIHSGNEMNDKQIVHIKMELAEIRQRIINLEKLSESQSTLQL